MKTSEKLFYYLEKICGILILLMPVSIAVGRGVADVNLSMVALLFFAQLIIKRDFSCFGELWVKVLLVLWGYVVINSLFRDSIVVSLSKTVPFVRFILFALCFQHMVYHYQNFDKKLFIVLSIVISFLVIDGYIQFFVGKDLFGRAKLFDNMGNYQYYRLTGPFSKRVLGSVITILSPALIAFLLYKIKEAPRKSILFFSAIILIELLVFLTGERSALIQGVLALVILVVYLFRAEINIPIILGVGVCLILVLYFLIPQDMILRHLDSIRILKQGSKSAYGMLWKASWVMGLENPWFGVGAANFQSVCETLVSECSYHSHNVYLEMFSEFGSVGLLLFLLFLYVLFKEIFVHLRKVKIDSINNALFFGSSVAILVKLIPFLPSSGFFKNWYAVPLWFMIGWMLRLKKSV